VAAWQTRTVWTSPGQALDWRPWIRRVVPLSLGLGASQFMLGADQLLVQSIFDREVTGLYGAAGTIGRALVVFTGPMLAVMFPKIVASAARCERTDVLAQALGATALLGGLAALSCTVLPELPLRLVYKREYWCAAPLVPWFAWCMLPLTLANVLIGNLLARERFRAVPWLVLVAGAYGAALLGRAQAFQQAGQFAAFTMVVRTIGGFSLLLLLVVSWFTWGEPWRARRRAAGAGGSPTP
jgi:O-antigen/teichoic acid export membrane protein